MNKNLFLIFSFLLLSISGFSQIDDKDLPPRPSPPRLVNDMADILSDAQETSLENKLDAYDDSTSTQIAVVTMSSIGNYDISDYATYLGRKWQVGQKEMNNGVVLLITMDTHDVWIATGYGTEPFITDAHAKQIIDGDLIPEFQNGNYYEGIDEATDDMIKYLSGQFVDDNSNKSKPVSNPWWVIFIVIFIIIIISRKFRGGGGTTFGGRGPTYWGGGMGGFGGGGFSGGGGGGFGGFGGGGFGGGGAGGRW